MEHQKAHQKGTAPWTKEWEMVLYTPGQIRNKKPMRKGAVFFRHKPCRFEYKPSNPSQTANTHTCETVGSRHTIACTSCRACCQVMCCCLHMKMPQAIA